MASWSVESALLHACCSCILALPTALLRSSGRVALGAEPGACGAAESWQRLRLQVGDRVTAGDIYAIVPENTLMTHKVMVPPGARGNITWMADKGQYDISEDVIEIEFAGQKKAR